MKFYIVETPYNDWIQSIQKHSDIICVSNIDQIPNETDVKIIPLTIDNMKKLTNDKRSLYWTDYNIMYILDNKCDFAQFMMQYFPENIPKVHYIKTINIEYYYDKTQIDIKQKLVKKNNNGYGGCGIKILHSLRDIDINENNIVVSTYIDHRDFFVGHFFVLNGEIMKVTYFKGSTNNTTNFILKCPITNLAYSIVDNLGYDEIFTSIFKKLNYNGFACSDFIIHNDKIILFEINPRPGGSLFHDDTTCRDFFNLVKKQAF
jgi:predicted ATP-grasp superfamily ATP-dependent carboligase